MLSITILIDKLEAAVEGVAAVLEGGAEYAAESILKLLI